MSPVLSVNASKESQKKRRPETWELPLQRPKKNDSMRKGGETGMEDAVTDSLRVT